MTIPIVTPRGIEDGKLPDRPPHGSFVLHCGHMLHAKRHFLYTPVAMIYHMDRVERKTHWAVVCENCRREAGGDFSKVKLKGVGQYAEPGKPMLHPPKKQGPSMTISVNTEEENIKPPEGEDNAGHSDHQDNQP